MYYFVVNEGGKRWSPMSQLKSISFFISLYVIMKEIFGHYERVCESHLF